MNILKKMKCNYNCDDFFEKQNVIRSLMKLLKNKCNQNCDEHVEKENCNQIVDEHIEKNKCNYNVDETVETKNVIIMCMKQIKKRQLSV